MAHLEFAQQCLWPELDVQTISVTEQWAQFAVAGPRSRELVNAVLDAPVDDASFPFMACGEVAVGGVAARLFRISFSGELGYELAVPSRYGAALWELLLEQARALGGGPYGLEALNVLRIEKGLAHPRRAARAHQRRRPRARAHGVGAQGLHRQGGEPARPGCSGPEREQLVGLRPLDPRRAAGGGGASRRHRAPRRCGRTTSAISPRPAIRRRSATPSRSASCKDGRGADRRDGAGGLPAARARRALRGGAAGLRRSGRRAAAWLSSSPRPAWRRPRPAADARRLHPRAAAGGGTGARWRRSAGATRRWRRRSGPGCRTRATWAAFGAGRIALGGHRTVAGGGCAGARPGGLARREPTSRTPGWGCG